MQEFEEGKVLGRKGSENKRKEGARHEEGVPMTERGVS